MKGGDCSKLVSCKFYLAKMAWVGEKDKKKGAEEGGDWYRVRCPLCLFSFF
jgi:hypothetical protein